MSTDARATAGGAKAALEERWFDEVVERVEEYLKAYVAHRDAPKGEREWLEVKMQQAKRDVLAAFPGPGFPQ